MNRKQYPGYGESSRHMAPVQNRDQFAMQPQNKCFLMKIDKHLEYLKNKNCIEVSLKSIHTEFQCFPSNFALNIITYLLRVNLLW